MDVRKWVEMIAKWSYESSAFGKENNRGVLPEISDFCTTILTDLFYLLEIRFELTKKSIVKLAEWFMHLHYIFLLCCTTLFEF